MLPRQNPVLLICGIRLAFSQLYKQQDTARDNHCCFILIWKSTFLIILPGENLVPHIFASCTNINKMHFKEQFS